jgi:uncharacterized CHY-type Zn-finger protein
MGNIKSKLVGKDDRCIHEKRDLGTNHDIWYLLKKERGDRYWCEKDAVYIRLRSTKEVYICQGCGERKTIQSAEKVGGRGNIKVKEEMPEWELRKFRNKVHCGGFYDGFPD